MSGQVIRVLPLQSFTFTDTGDGKTISVVVEKKIDVSQFKEADLLVRLHSATIPAFPATLTVRAIQDLNTSEDPATEFYGDSIGEVSFDSGDSAGSGKSVALDDNCLGSLIALIVEAKQRSESDTFEATISADLVLRE